MWRGRNWARVLYLVLVVLSLMAFPSSLNDSQRPVVEIGLEAVSFVADAGSLFLLFTTPGSLWFQMPASGARRRRRGREAAGWRERNCMSERS